VRSSWDTSPSAALRLDHGAGALRHLVEGAPDIAELVLAPEVRTRGGVALAELAGGGRELIERRASRRENQIESAPTRIRIASTAATRRPRKPGRFGA